MKRFIVLTAALILLIIIGAFGLTACGTPYSSHYNAVGHVHSNDSDAAWTSFVELEGTEVFKMKCKGGQTAKIQYSGKLETGSLTVYYDCGEGKTELFSVNSVDKAEPACISLNEGSGTVYIIVETSEKCLNGNLNFELVYD